MIFFQFNQTTVSLYTHTHCRNINVTDTPHIPTSNLTLSSENCYVWSVFPSFTVETKLNIYGYIPSKTNIGEFSAKNKTEIFQTFIYTP